MARVNVYLQDELAEAVKALGLPVSTICQEALSGALTDIANYSALASSVGVLPLTDSARAVLRAASFASAGRPRTARDLLVEAGKQEGVARCALGTLSVAPEAFENLVHTGEEDGGFDDEIRPSSRSGHEVIQAAMRAAVSLGHRYIGVDHLLLGFAECRHPWVTEALASLGIDGERLRSATLDCMASTAPATSAPTSPAAPLDAVHELDALVRRIEQRVTQLEAHQRW